VGCQTIKADLGKLIDDVDAAASFGRCHCGRMITRFRNYPAVPTRMFAASDNAKKTHLVVAPRIVFWTVLRQKHRIIPPWIESHGDPVLHV